MNNRDLFSFCMLLAGLVVLLSAPFAPVMADDQEADKSQTVLITGANRGIGLELARQYSEAGWHVIGTARKPDAAVELASLGADVLQLDVTDQESVEGLAHGLDGRPIDLLINNAGIQPLMWKLADVDFEAFDRAMAVNTTGPVRVTQALMPNLYAGQGRLIVNITSNLGSIAKNTDGAFYGYRESKAALNMFTKSLAGEFGPDGFICIVMNPGWVQTDMGGDQAPLKVHESVSGIRRAIDGLGPEDNGTFRTWAGDTMPW